MSLYHPFIRYGTVLRTSCKPLKRARNASTRTHQGNEGKMCMVEVDPDPQEEPTKMSGAPSTSGSRRRKVRILRYSARPTCGGKRRVEGSTAEGVRLVELLLANGGTSGSTQVWRNTVKMYLSPSTTNKRPPQGINAHTDRSEPVHATKYFYSEPRGDQPGKHWAGRYGSISQCLYPVYQAVRIPKKCGTLTA